MSPFQVFLVAGTHGNEINGPWLLENWDKDQDEYINSYGINFFKEIGNPIALAAGKRYIDNDLNRSFSPSLLSDTHSELKEVKRAQELVKLYGPKGSNPCQVAIDLHTTTSSMGSCLVLYGRRPADLALASLVQAKLGLPIYLHEGDDSQKGFLVESWPCGFVIEVGPVPQSLLNAKIIEQTRIAIEACFESIMKILSGSRIYPKRLIVHRHIKSIDYPRDLHGRVEACLDKSIQGNDWYPIAPGSPLFVKKDGQLIYFDEKESLIPVFINEASYLEKNISFSLTRRESWDVEEIWKISLEKLIKF